MEDDNNINTNLFSEPNLPDGLVLFFHPKNFYSQKVLLILYEKNIAFTPYVLNLAHGEQYSSWFLNKNPKGEVPVLQDNALVVPNSKSIINYLEEKFKGENYPSLSLEKSLSKELTKSAVYEEILGQLPIGALSLGSFIHDDLNLVPKPPFVGQIRKSCIENNEKVYEILKKSASQAVTYRKASLQKKLELLDRRKKLVYSRNEFQKILDHFEFVLKEFEKDLTGKSEKEWLISSDFFAIDVSFGLLLHRLDGLGFENYFWKNNKLPNIEKYFNRFKQRKSYKKLMPTNVEILKDMWSNTPAQYKFGAGVVGMAMFAAFAHK